MGNSDSFCCRKQKNKDLDIVDLYIINDNDKLIYLIKLQSHIRKFLTKIKTNKLISDIPFSLSKAPGMILDKSFVPKFEKINKKLLELKGEFEKFDFNTKENLLKNQNELKDFSIIYKDKSFYKGFFNKNWEKEGFGILILPDGSQYEGFFSKDEMSGKGRIINSEGFYYEGEFKNNRANGYGKYINLDGTTYVGFWLDDKQNGFGEEFFNDESKYEGNYVNGKKTGKGKFIWSEDSFYEGNFENNDLHGLGEYHWKDGRVYTGEWEKNKMHGVGLFLWPDNKKYIGSYRNDKKKGYGIFSWPEGKSFEGEWNEGKQNGYGILKTKNGIKYGQWINGQKTRYINANDKYQISSLDNVLKEKKNEFDFSKAQIMFKKEFESIKNRTFKDYKEDALIIETLSENNKIKSNDNLKNNNRVDLKSCLEKIKIREKEVCEYINKMIEQAETGKN